MSLISGPYDCSTKRQNVSGIPNGEFLIPVKDKPVKTFFDTHNSRVMLDNSGTGDGSDYCIQS
jgi:hypothetical protein